MNQIVLEALDALALALVKHKHQWSNGLRSKYSAAVQEVYRPTKRAGDKCPACAGSGSYDTMETVEKCPVCNGTGICA